MFDVWLEYGKTDKNFTHKKHRMTCPNQRKSNDAPTWSSYEDSASYGESPTITKSSGDKKMNKAVLGAAIAGGAVGLIAVGPIVGVAAGLAAAVTAASNSGPVGSLARASGDAVMATGRAAKKFNKDHHIVEKTKNLFKKTKEEAQKLDEKHHIVEKTKNAANNVVRKAQEFENQHHVMEKTAQGISSIATRIDPEKR